MSAHSRRLTLPQPDPVARSAMKKAFWRILPLIALFAMTLTLAVLILMLRRQVRVRQRALAVAA
jgi:hypothetical protein